MQRSVLTLLVALLPLTVHAAPPAPAHFFAEDVSLTECGTGEVRALRFFRVGQATLASARCDGDLNPPLRLVFRYRREVPGDAFGKAAEAMIGRNMTDDAFQQLKPRLQAFNSHYRDIGADDVYQLDYDADGRLLLSLNDQPLVMEQGDDFARAYLKIWFGERPYSADLKQALLGD